MNLIRYSPSSLDLADNVSRWFDDMFVDLPTGRTTVPAVDVRESETEFLMEVDLPGLSEKDIEVKLDNNLLTISSRKEESKEGKRTATSCARGEAPASAAASCCPRRPTGRRSQPSSRTACCT